MYVASLIDPLPTFCGTTVQNYSMYSNSTEGSDGTSQTKQWATRSTIDSTPADDEPPIAGSSRHPRVSRNPHIPTVKEDARLCFRQQGFTIDILYTEYA